MSQNQSPNGKTRNSLAANMAIKTTVAKSNNIFNRIENNLDEKFSLRLSKINTHQAKNLTQNQKEPDSAKLSDAYGIGYYQTKVAKEIDS